CVHERAKRGVSLHVLILMALSLSLSSSLFHHVSLSVSPFLCGERRPGHTFCLSSLAISLTCLTTKPSVCVCVCMRVHACVCVCVCVCMCEWSVHTSERNALGSPQVHGPAWPSLCVARRSEEHTSELQSHLNLVCRLL